MNLRAPIQLDNDFVRQLPGDPELRNFRRQVGHACWSKVEPLRFPGAKLLAWSQSLSSQLGLSPVEMGEERFARIFSGSELLPGSEPYAQCYGGHQFGNWAGQLGDGRAINLGEVRDCNGQQQVLQLKGAGPTPYSRTADGLAVLRSSLREYLCSEAMHHLGIATTRALSLVATGEQVVRDMFYDGNPKHEPGAVVCRVAPSFLRFGSYEIFAARNDIATLKTLADYTIRRDFAALPRATAPDVETYIAWFDTVCQRTARLLIDWMRVGFVHGVMNTDNMSILGLTIDYGPYGWLEPHDPHWTPNTTDAEGRRYRYGQQPQIALWNLVQLANALYPLINDVKPLEDALDRYRGTYEREWLAMMQLKLGLLQHSADDQKLMEALLQSFSHVETDYTLFFRTLGSLPLDAEVHEVPAALRACWYDDAPGTGAEQATRDWLQRYRLRLVSENSAHAARQAAMNGVNPLYVPRNWLLQLAIDEAEQGGTAKLRELEQVLQQPYSEQPGKQHLAQKRPEWARQRAGCSMLSCSS
ncbi:MAG TPA: YdiU family protein [Candidatus Acidoferrum sp.]|nr:YdiU family protein [Candidatus Acidoferrum sp.]